MSLPLRLLLTALALLLAAPASAATIYKCRQAGGVVSYQDNPCPGRQIGVLRTPTTAAAARAPAATTAPAKATSEAARPTPTARAPRPSFKCVRPDGSHYYTGNARPARMLVDASNTVAKRVAGAPAAPPGKAWAEDQCANSTRAESCQYYQEQIAANDAREAAAKGTDASRLKREGQRLRAIRNHRCN
ncbi:MAG: DUF4124 domain-containing protein [Lysobacterales bacterium]